MSNPANEWVPHRFARPAAQLRLFCYPHAGGAALAFRAWADRLPSTVELCPLEPPGRWSRHRETPFRRVGPAASSLARGLAPLLDLPFVCLGHSLGASVVFEASRLLCADPQVASPEAVIVCARAAPHLGAEDIPIDDLDDDALLDWVERRYGAERLKGARDPAFREMFLAPMRADLEMYVRYQHEPGPPLPVALHACGGTGDRSLPRAHIEAWSAYTSGPFDARMFEGDHFFVHEPSSGFLDHLATILEALS